MSVSIYTQLFLCLQSEELFCLCSLPHRRVHGQQTRSLPSICFPEVQPPSSTLPLFQCSDMVPGQANLPQTQMIRTAGNGGNTGVNCPPPRQLSNLLEPLQLFHLPSPPYPSHPPHLPHHLHRLGHAELTRVCFGHTFPSSPAASSCSCSHQVPASGSGTDPVALLCAPFPAVRVTPCPHSSSGWQRGSSRICLQRVAAAGQGAGHGDALRCTGVRSAEGMRVEGVRMSGGV